MSEENVNQRVELKPADIDDSWWEGLLADEERYLRSNESIPPQTLDTNESRQVDVDWSQAEDVYEQDRTIYLKVTGSNRGGLLVEGDDLLGFVPLSHLIDLDTELSEVERSDALEAYVGETLCLKIIECCPERGRVVLSQRAALAGSGKRLQLFDELQDGDRVTGTITNVTNFGAFVDLGGVEGLIHVSELSWGRVRHPCDIVNVGRQVETMVLNIDRERCRVALSLKRLNPNPWEYAEQHYIPGQSVDAVITSVVSFGAFARLEDGLDGLIHVSALADDNEKIDPRQLLSEGQHVRVRILHVDASHQRLGLSLEKVV